jgi:hypothetical protein
VTAILQRDTSAMRSILSTDVLEQLGRNSADLDAAILAKFESQRGGLIMNFGEDWLSNNEIQVAEVLRAGDNLVSATVVIDGERSPKPVFFAVEDGEFKFAGTSPPTSAARNSVAATAPWNHWHFHNWGTIAAGVLCGIPTASSYKGVMYSGGDMNPVNCDSNNVGIGKFTLIKFDPFNEYGCMYQFIGVDAFYDSSNVFHCTPP